MSSNRILAACLCAGALTAPLAAQAGKDPIPCAFANSPITVDGELSDWGQPLTYMDDWKSSVGMRSDSKNLYLCFSIADRGLRRQAIMGGLTVWIDPHGGKKEILGIRYPMPMVMPAGMQGGGMRGMGDDGGGPPGMGAGDSPREGRTDGDAAAGDSSSGRRRRGAGSMSRFKPRLTDVELLGPGPGEKHWFHVDSLQGLAVKIIASPDSIIYELRIPLTASGDNPFAVGAEPGSVIGIGLQTGEIQIGGGTARGRRGGPEGGEGGEGEGGEGGGGGFGGRGRRGGGGGMPGGGGGMPGGGGGFGRGGGDGGEGGGFGGGRAGRNMQQVKIDDWVKVQLAVEGGAAK